jgi:hypothetical protein
MPNFGIFRHLTNDFQKKKAAREKAALNMGWIRFLKI